MHTLISLDEAHPGPVVFLNVHPSLSTPTAGVEVRDAGGAVALRIGSTDPAALAVWARELSLAADRLAAEHSNRQRGDRRLRPVETAPAAAGVVAGGSGGLGVLRRAVAHRLVPVTSGARVW